VTPDTDAHKTSQTYLKFSDHSVSMSLSGTELIGRFNEAVDLARGVDVRHAATFAVLEVIRWRQLVTIVFDADVTGEAATVFSRSSRCATDGP
jgi:hypothetical protein